MQLRFDRILRPAGQHLAKFIEPVLGAGAGMVFGIFARESAINQHELTPIRTDQISANTDHAAIAVNTKQAEIENGQGDWPAVQNMIHEVPASPADVQISN